MARHPITCEVLVHEHPRRGCVLEFRVEGEDHIDLMHDAGPRLKAEVSRLRPEWLVMNLREFGPTIAACTRTFLVMGYAAMRDHDKEQRARILATGATANEIRRVFKLLGLLEPFGGDVYEDLEAALSEEPGERAGQENL